MALEYNLEKIIKVADALKQAEEKRISVLPESGIDGLETEEARKMILEIGEGVGCEERYMLQALDMIYPTPGQISELEKRFSCETVTERQTVINRTFRNNIQKVKNFLQDLNEELNPYGAEIRQLSPDILHQINPLVINGPYQKKGRFKSRNFEEMINDESTYNTSWDFSLKESPSTQGKHDDDPLNGVYYRPDGVILSVGEFKKQGIFKKKNKCYAHIEMIVNGRTFTGRYMRDGMKLIEKPVVLLKAYEPETLSLVCPTIERHKETIENKIKIYY